MPTDKVGVALLSDSEIPACFQLISKSFGHDSPFVDAWYPNHDTPSGQAQGSKRLVALKQKSKNSTYLKATITRQASQGYVQEEQGEEQIIGFAIWTLTKDPPPTELEKLEGNVEEVWPDKDDREYTIRLWRDLVIPRTRAIRESNGKGAYVLDFLAVHPDYQRLGAGRALVEWGTRAADRQGLTAVVEATPVGRPLYEKCGMRAEIEEMRFDIGEEFSKRRVPKLTFLKKEPGP